MIHRLVITPGEPAGIGPDLVLQLAQQDHAAELVVVADPELLVGRAQALGLEIQLEHYAADQEAAAHQAGRLKVIPVTLAAEVRCGELNVANGPYVLETLTVATQACLRGEFDALVTAPVHKGIINDAGVPFSGHTEFLADLTDTAQVVMMLATPGLRVALATTHLPLRDVSDAITDKLLEDVIRILDRDLQQKFGITHPKVLVCGLNPHAGEGGHLGAEDDQIIAPVLQRLQAQGMDLVGPLPADTLFVPRYLEQADAVLAMYHDQGLPVLKHKGFGNAVNVTLGLPIIRTSVDHGTALELAGTGKADTGSLSYAIETAIHMCQQQSRV